MPSRHAVFRALHDAPNGFVLPNVWDAGSAAIVAAAGFPAIASTSAGIAFSLARPDYDPSCADRALSRTEMFDRLREIVAAVRVPVNADLEAGYGDSPDAVALTIGMAVDAGLSGGNIEDRNPKTGELYDESLAVERIAAARDAIATRRAAFVLTARTDPMLAGHANALDTAIRRANRFREAGADCLYAPGVSTLDDVRTLVREIGGPINVVNGLGKARFNMRELLDAGVQRISLGGAIARSALGFVRACAQELRERGTIGFTSGQIMQSELNALFGAER